MTEPAILELRRLSFRYPNGRLALRDISCRVASHERVAVVGPSGAGKSTLLMHCNGLLPSPPVQHDGEAQVFVNGLAVTKPQLRETRRQVGFLFQDPEGHILAHGRTEQLVIGVLK